MLVPPLMLAAEIYDVSPSSSGVSVLHDHGIDPWVIDFGAPERQRGGLERTLGDHVLAVSEAVDRVREVTGGDVHLAGYSQGGMFCYQTAAYRRNDGLASLITFGSPVDTRLGMPFGLPEQLAVEVAEALAIVFGDGGVRPGSAAPGFACSTPSSRPEAGSSSCSSSTIGRNCCRASGSDASSRAKAGWRGRGRRSRNSLSEFVASNRMLEGGFVVEDRLLSLADVDCPILSVVGTVDEIAPAPGVRAIRQAAPSADVYELAVHAGHFGLVVGTTSTNVTWPTVAGWVNWRAGAAELPANLTRVPDDGAVELAPQVRNRVAYGVELATGVGAGIARTTIGTAGRAVRGVRELTREAAAQLPRLARLEHIEPGTRISIGLLVEERRRRSPNDAFFLFEDRAYDAAEVGERIDNVVRGLISIGVRQGEHVGVLMGPRPSALALAVAISRVGAVSVLLRPDGDLGRRSGSARSSGSSPTPSARRSPPGSAASTRSCSEAVPSGATSRPTRSPTWSGSTRRRWRCRGGTGPTRPGRRSRVRRVQRGGRQHEGEPDHEPPVGPVGVRNGVIGRAQLRRHAVHGRARVSPVGADDEHRRRDRRRIATARWPGCRSLDLLEEVRRYGATVASYTWTSLEELVQAPARPAERHHPLRLFIGSGMPRGLWRRVEERFRPARVVEFTHVHRSRAILANVRGAKSGSMGRAAARKRRGVRIGPTNLDAEGLVPAATVSPTVRRRRGRDAAGPGRPERATHRDAAAVAVRPRRCLGATGDLFGATPMGLLAGGRDRRCDPRRPMARCSRPPSATRSARSPPSVCRSPTAWPARRRPRAGDRRDHPSRRPDGHRQGQRPGAVGMPRRAAAVARPCRRPDPRSRPGSGRWRGSSGGGNPRAEEGRQA